MIHSITQQFSHGSVGSDQLLFVPAQRVGVLQLAERRRCDLKAHCSPCLLLLCLLCCLLCSLLLLHCLLCSLLRSLLRSLPQHLIARRLSLARRLSC